MPNTLPGLRRERAAAAKRVTKLATAARGRSMTDDEQHDFDAASGEVEALDEQITAAEAAATEPKDKGISRAEAAEVAKLCVDGGVPAMASTLLAEGVSVDEAKARIAAAGKAKDLVAQARRVNPSIPADLAATMLAEGKTVEDIRTALFDKLVAAEKETSISSHVPAAGGNAGLSASRASMERVLKRSNPVKES